jgi:hypothetical protein
MAAVAISPASGSITAIKTVCRVTCSAVANNTTTGYDPAIYPSEPQVTYYFKLASAGQPTLKSHVFSTNASQVAAWDDVVFPAAGTWTMTINKTSDDSVTATASVTVA